MWLGLRAIIQAKDTFDYVVKFRRKVDQPRAPAVSAAWVFVFLQFDAKRLVHGRNGAGENDGPARWALFLHQKFVLPGKRLDESNAVRVRTVALFEFFATQDDSFLNRFREFSSVDNRLLPCARAQTDCHVHSFVGISWAYLSCSF
jgi:hypothetical protein